MWYGGLFRSSGACSVFKLVKWSYCYVLVALHLSLVLPVVDTFCPPVCQCNDQALETSCMSSRLDTVPILLNPALRTLKLSHNRISSLRQSFTFYSELRRLDLSQNALHSLGSRHFESLQYLEWLNVSYNMISSLESDAFTGLLSLTFLDLSNNRLTILQSNLFSELTSLQTLLLSGNKIQTIQENTFDSLRRLQILRLDDNNIRHVPSPSLNALYNLRALNLGKNLIEMLDDSAFDKLVKLQVLRLNDNAIGHIDPMALHNLKSLEVLDLSSNRLDSAPVKALPSSLLQLKHVDFSGNMWRDLPARFLQTLPQLESLNISYMEYLHVVHDEALRGSFNSNLSLTHLTMTNNALWSRIPNGFLDHLPNLKRLDLSANAFKMIDPLPGLAYWKLEYLNVAYNPLECNCSLLWLWNLLRNTYNTVDNATLILMNVTCSSPELLRGMQLSALSDQDLPCTSSLPIVVVILVFIFTLITLALVILSLVCCRQKKRRKTGRTSGTSPILTKNGSPSSAPHYYQTTGDDEYTYHCAGSIKRIPVTVV